MRKRNSSQSPRRLREVDQSSLILFVKGNLNDVHLKSECVDADGKVMPDETDTTQSEGGGKFHFKYFGEDGSICKMTFSQEGSEVKKPLENMDLGRK